VLVVEDAAQAQGAEYKGRRAGSMGALACFSFYPGKNLGAYGEAGAVVTNDEKYVDVIKQLRDQGQSAKYLHDRVGYNYRMEAIQGAVLGVKLRHLDAWTEARRELADIYTQALAGSRVRLLAEPAECKSVYHIFPLFTPERDELREHLHANGISTGVHYPIPVHLQRGFSNLGFKEGDLPVTEQVCREVLSLPMYAELEHATALEIASSVRQFAQPAVAMHP
jgi:dTDP-4-amino-4,6-dideoxygalactose transaminase